MQLHLVGGFLGSGKTTAILSTARILAAQEKVVGIITNDQGKYLVDTELFRFSDFSTVEVTGGCFCCHYDDLTQKMDHLIEKAHPDVIFAESVGSCADLVATVIRPLFSLNSAGTPPASFSVFADSRLLRFYLLGESLPFADEIVYIFAKQLEEASLVVINKIDLLEDRKLAEVIALFAKKFPGKKFIVQNSLAQNGTQSWLKKISTAKFSLPVSVLEMDYPYYGEGEAKLAWLDEVLTVTVPEGRGREEIVKVLQRIYSVLHEENIPIGHLKLLISDGMIQSKISLTSLDQPDWLDPLPELHGTQIDLLINGRVQMKAADFKELINKALLPLERRITENYIQAFHPGYPNPTHRFDKVEFYWRNKVYGKTVS
jgi:Ni2+-binding GTPase involved in maturation of urease and hydrogenase